MKIDAVVRYSVDQIKQLIAKDCGDSIKAQVYTNQVRFECDEDGDLTEAVVVLEEKHLRAKYQAEAKRIDEITALLP